MNFNYYFHINIIYTQVFSIPTMVIRGHQLHLRDEIREWAFTLFDIANPIARITFHASVYTTLAITFE